MNLQKKDPSCSQSRLWKEGFDQRISRKQNGFKHDKIEWDVITARFVCLLISLFVWLVVSAVVGWLVEIL